MHPTHTVHCTRSHCVVDLELSIRAINTKRSHHRDFAPLLDPSFREREKKNGWARGHLGRAPSEHSTPAKIMKQVANSARPQSAVRPDMPSASLPGRQEPLRVLFHNYFPLALATNCRVHGPGPRTCTYQEPQSPPSVSVIIIDLQFQPLVCTPPAFLVSGSCFLVPEAPTPPPHVEGTSAVIFVCWNF